MKLILAILAVLAVAGQLNAYKIPSTGSGELAKDFQDIIDLIPLDEMIVVTRTYANQDKEFQQMMNLAKSSDSKEFIAFVEAAPEFKEIMAYVQNHGLDVYQLINKYNEIMNIPSFKPLEEPQRAITGGISGYVQDIAQLVPVDKVLEMEKEKMINSEAFKGLIDQILNPKFLNFYNSLLQNEIYLRLGKRAEQIGIDKDLFQTYYELFLMLIPLNK